MPLVQVKLVEGVFSEAQQKEMIQKITDAMVSIEGENMRQVTTVVIEEVKSGDDWGVGGKALTTDDVMALAGGNPTDYPCRWIEGLAGEPYPKIYIDNAHNILLEVNSHANVALTLK